MNKGLIKKLKNIKLIITDVDGVLTDGKIYILPDGEELKVFPSRDSFRMEAAIRSGIKIIWFTGRKSKAVIKRSQEIEGVRLIFKQDVGGGIFELVKKEYGFSLGQIAYVGDDWSDLNSMSKVAVSISPADGTAENRRIADIVTRAFGGHGVLSEAVEIIMKAQGTWKKFSEAYIKKFIL